MILVFLLLLSACAACHTCEDPAFERITSTTIIEKKEVGFSGLLVILENSVRNLAEKQANMTSGMNHSYFNLADSAVGNDAYNHDEEIFLADSRNESNLSNCSLSLQSTPPDTKNYHLYLNTLTPVSPTLVALASSRLETRANAWPCWDSKRIQRVVRSTFAGETLSAVNLRRHRRVPRQDA